MKRWLHALRSSSPRPTRPDPVNAGADTEAPSGGLSLFWRTFVLLVLLLAGALLTWMPVLRALGVQSPAPAWLHPLTQTPQWLWITGAVGLSLAGAALVAGLINQPLQQLWLAAGRVRGGDFKGRPLDEAAVTREVRAVNIGFNRMAMQLAQVEQDRALMLAGISHDLRTPLARLRLETEMSVADPDARALMAADIDQLDAIIDKFLDYARPQSSALQPVALRPLVQACVARLREARDLQVHLEIPRELAVRADAVDLARVVNNLLENARRYGRTPGQGRAQVQVSAGDRGPWVLVTLRDHGPGVPVEVLPELMKPFFRGDRARTEASGAGLGLAIVDKTLQRMGGALALANAAGGGLAAHLRLQRAHPLDEGSAETEADGTSAASQAPR